MGYVCVYCLLCAAPIDSYGLFLINQSIEEDYYKKVWVSPLDTEWMKNVLGVTRLKIISDVKIDQDVGMLFDYNGQNYFCTRVPGELLGNCCHKACFDIAKGKFPGLDDKQWYDLLSNVNNGEYLPKNIDYGPIRSICDQSFIMNPEMGDIMPRLLSEPIDISEFTSKGTRFNVSWNIILPREILELIFEFIDHKSLLIWRSVSKLFEMTVIDHSIWKQILNQEFFIKSTKICDFEVFLSCKRSHSGRNRARIVNVIDQIVQNSQK